MRLIRKQEHKKSRFSVELRSHAAKPLAVIYGGTILTESPFVFTRTAQPGTLVCVYSPSTTNTQLELWKVNANGTRKKLAQDA